MIYDYIEFLIGKFVYGFMFVSYYSIKNYVVFYDYFYGIGDIISWLSLEKKKVFI